MHAHHTLLDPGSSSTTNAPHALPPRLSVLLSLPLHPPLSPRSALSCQLINSPAASLRGSSRRTVRLRRASFQGQPGVHWRGIVRRPCVRFRTQGALRDGLPGRLLHNPRPSRREPHFLAVYRGRTGSGRGFCVTRSFFHPTSHLRLRTTSHGGRSAACCATGCCTAQRRLQSAGCRPGGSFQLAAKDWTRVGRVMSMCSIGTETKRATRGRGPHHHFSSRWSVRDRPTARPDTRDRLDPCSVNRTLKGSCRSALRARNGPVRKIQCSVSPTRLELSQRILRIAAIVERRQSKVLWIGSHGSRTDSMISRASFRLSRSASVADHQLAGLA